MYSEWTSLISSLQCNVQRQEHRSILHKLSPAVSREIVNLTVKQLCTDFSIIYSTEPSVLKVDKEVLWCMEVICFGLSLPFEDHDTIRDCVNIYCEWLSAFNAVPNVSVPKPICQDVNYYSQKIIAHFLNLFVPRREEGSDSVSKQVVLCHRVLRTLQHIAQFSTKLDVNTWNCLLVFLLDITDMLLISTILPVSNNAYVEDDVGDHLCQRVLGVLLEVWLNACIKCFPSPSLWKTLHEICVKWKYHTAVIDLWNRVNYVLTNQILRIMYKIPYHLVPGNDEVKQLALKMNNDCVVQAWYRFLKVIGNPVDLCQPALQQPSPFLPLTKPVGSYNHFWNNAWSNFYNAMKGISELIHILLDSFSVALENNACTYGMPTCNSILHLFGEWLYEVAYMGTEVAKQHGSSIKDASTTSTVSSNSSSYSNANSQPGSLTGMSTDKQFLDMGRYNVGYSEAIGALCHVFCSKKTKEEILPVYLSRFYIILHQAFRINEHWDYEEMMSSIIFNSSNLLRIDLDGILLLITSVIRTLEFVLSDKFRVRKSVIKGTEIRRSAIHLLLSILPLPSHFENMSLKEPVHSFLKFNTDNTFGHLKSQLANILISALQTETDSYNTHMLLCGILFSVQDSVLSEEAWLLQERCKSDGTESACYLFVKGIYLICHHLVSVWKMDLNISFAALEMLSAISKLQIQESDDIEMKWVIRWLCDFIIHQCWRPPQAHSKDLHSSIVGAFNCASTWLVSNKNILRDKEYLALLLEVVELGISGIKVDVKIDNDKMKDSKTLKPVSLRVRNAAEGLLSTIVEQVDCCFLTKSGTFSSHVLAEYYLMPSSKTQKKSGSKFQHFILENNVISISQIPVANKQEFQPMVMLLTRNCYGRYTWILQLRQFPRSKSSHRLHQTFNSWRPVSMIDVCSTAPNKSSFFPEIAPRITTQRVDNSLPSLEQLSESILNDDPLCDMIEKQHEAERYKRSQLPFVECNVLPSNSLYSSGRLFLSHLNHLSKIGSNKDSHSTMVPLNANCEQLERDLLNLDSTTQKTTCACYVFYVKTGQKHYKDILNNICLEGSLCDSFLQILHSLGWPIRICENTDWASYIPGHVKNKCLDKSDVDSTSNSYNGCTLCNDGSNAFYWSDVLSQILFVTPTTFHTEEVVREQLSGVPPVAKSSGNAEAVILLIWTESLEDSLYFPFADVLNYISTRTLRYGKPLYPQDCYAIFLHPLQNGLLHIKLLSPHNRTDIATPLANGMVISKRTAGLLIRQTIININKRKIFESEDSSLQAHVYRKTKIQEINHKYGLKATYPELLERLII